MTASSDIAETGSPAFHHDPEADAGMADIADLYSQLVDLSEAERTARLEQLDRDCPSCSAELRALLGAAARAGDFLAILDQPSPVVDTEGRESPGFSSGQEIGPYRLERLLGRGAVGTVWLASDRRLDRKVALKLFTSPLDASQSDSGSRMLREARMVAQFDHPNIAAVHDVGETADGVGYMAMAWCEGGSLADRLRHAPLSIESALAMALDLASALEAAHARGLLHRDIKPGNVLFDAEGRGKLGDFGIALPFAGIGSAVERAGTLAYAPPEVLLGGSADARSDLWSLGVTIFEAVTGTAPFWQGSPASIVQQILGAEPAIGDGSSEMAPLEPLLNRLLRKDPAERPQSASDLRRELIHLRTRLRSGQRAYSPPMPLTPLVGRTRLMTRAVELLQRNRLLTLTGPGGTGKTRLALELAIRREPLHAAGACYVPLAALPSVEQVPDAIADALALSQRGRGNAMELVRQFCVRSDLLLVLDNCEHMPDVAGLIGRLLSCAPDLRILATSRAPLGVDGEQELPVPPLELPSETAADPAAQRNAEAVQLFLQRAAARLPSLTMGDDQLASVATICRRLDGLPLAIELAAARVRTLGINGLLQRLEQSTTWLQAVRRDPPARHRTLGDAIGWSYDLLNSEEQRLFRLVSVCEDAFRQETAVALLHDAPVSDAHALLESLADNALVIAQPSPDGGARFAMLSTIRDYARDRLEQAGEATLAGRRHAEWFSSCAIEVGSALTGPDQVLRLAQLREVQHDIRAALSWLIDHEEFATAARMATALHRHWLVRTGSLREVVTLLSRLEERLTRVDDLLDPALHADLLRLLGSLTGTIGTHQTIPHRYFEASLARYRAAGDIAGMARALNHLGWSAHLLGRLAEGAQASAEALELHRQRHDASGIATSCINLGWIALLRGEFADAERYFQQARSIHQHTGDQRSLAYATGHVASLALARGDADRALQLRKETGLLLQQVGDQLAWPTFEVRFIQCTHQARQPVSRQRLETDLLPMLRAAGHGWALGYALGVLAELRLDSGDLPGARAAAEESLSVRRAAGVRSGEAESERLLGRIALQEGRPADSARHLAAAIGAHKEMGERIGLIDDVEAVCAWMVHHDPEGAITLAAGCTAVRASLGAARTPRVRHWIGEIERAARATCGSTAGRRAEQEGARLDSDDLVRRATDRLIRYDQAEQ